MVVNSKRDFKRLAADARKDGLLPVSSSVDITELGNSLNQKLGIEDPRELEYVIERVILGEAPDDEILNYLKALGEPLVSNSEEKSKALSHFIKEVQEAGAQSVCDSYNKLLCLLNRQDSESNEKPLSQNSFVGLPESQVLYVVGDLHGDAHTASLLCKSLGRVLDNASAADGGAQVVFLGDYVNNGLQSIDTLIEVLEFQEKHKGNVFLLSGNHEFAETLATAFNEFFVTHWNQWRNFSEKISPCFKKPPKHYGHIYTELLWRYGLRRGLEIYSRFAKWGRNLPILALSTKGILMCHSLGLRGGDMSLPTKRALVQAKSDRVDIDELETVGYEAWKRHRKTLHSQMVNNRLIRRSTLDRITQLFENNVFVVGHTHYRSGDRDILSGDVLVNAHQGSGWLATLCSSHPRSPDAGHYIAYELEFSRKKEERLYARTGVAQPCVACFTTEKVPLISEENVIQLQEVV